MYKVKLHIPAPPDFLPVFVFRSKWHVLSSFYYWYIGLNKSIAACLAKIHPEVHIMLFTRTLVIIEYTTYASSFITPVRVYKVIIAYLFKIGVKAVVETVTYIFIHLVKMPGVFFK